MEIPFPVAEKDESFGRAPWFPATSSAISSPKILLPLPSSPHKLPLPLSFTFPSDKTKSLSKSPFFGMIPKIIRLAEQEVDI